VAVTDPKVTLCLASATSSQARIGGLRVVTFIRSFGGEGASRRVVFQRVKNAGCTAQQILT